MLERLEEYPRDLEQELADVSGPDPPAQGRRPEARPLRTGCWAKRDACAALPRPARPSSGCGGEESPTPTSSRAREHDLHGHGFGARRRRAGRSRRRVGLQCRRRAARARARGADPPSGWRTTATRSSRRSAQPAHIPRPQSSPRGRSPRGDHVRPAGVDCATSGDAPRAVAPGTSAGRLRDAEQLDLRLLLLLLNSSITFCATCVGTSS